MDNGITGRAHEYIVRDSVHHGKNLNYSVSNLMQINSVGIHNHRATCTEPNNTLVSQNKSPLFITTGGHSF